MMQARSAKSVESAATGGWRHFPRLNLSRILEVALAQFVEHGYDATSVRVIAQKVGVTVPALYYHHENKQALLVALLDHGMELVGSHVDAALAEAGDDPAARLSAMVEAISLYSAHHRDLAFLDSERRSLTSENLRRYIDRRDAIDRRLRVVIEDGVAAGVFRTTVPDEVHRAILVMCQGISGWFREDGPKTAEETAETYVQITLAAVQYTPH